MKPGHEAYLGDGVYVKYDGFGIVLDLRAQDDSVIALEPEVFEALLRFAEKAFNAEIKVTYNGRTER